MFFLALIGVEGDAAAEVGGGFLEQIPLGTLNDVPGRGTAVLGIDAHGLEAAILHRQHAAGVDAPGDVGRIVDLVGRAEEAHHIADIVDAQVHQCAAGAGRVKGRPDLAGAEIMIPAGILAEITLHHRDGAHLGQHLTDLGVVVLILRGDSLEEEELFAPGQLGQLFGQRRRGGHRLFDDDVASRFQSGTGIFYVHDIRYGDIHNVHPAQQFVVAGGVARHTILVAEGLCCTGAPLRAAKSLDLEGAFRPGEPGQELPDDHACAENA